MIETARVKQVYWKDEIGGKIEELEVEAYRYGYTVGPHGEWQMLIAKEDKEVEENRLTDIKIEDVKVPEKAIILPCYIMRHALGIVSALTKGGKPKMVEEQRIFDTAIFHPIRSGYVRKGELLGVVNIFYATIERRLTTNVVERWLRERYRY